MPQAGFQADMLIGAGCVAVVETSGVTLGEYGQAPRFREAVSTGLVTIRDSTCPAIHAGLQASEKGVPFIPLRGILGSDLQAHRDDWRVIDNPFAEDDEILLLPAIQPDVALFHAAVADRDGNVWIGVRRELMTMAHASRRTLVTVEEIAEDDLLADDRTAAGTIPALYVTAIAEAREGAWPVGSPRLLSSRRRSPAALRGAGENRRGLRTLPRRARPRAREWDELPARGAHDHRDRGAARACEPCRRRRDVPDPRGSCLACPRALRGSHARLAPRQREAQLLHRRRTRAVRLRRAGTDRRLLPRRSADRRRREHQSRGHGRLPAQRASLPRLVRLGPPLLPRAEGDPLPAGALAPDAGSDESTSSAPPVSAPPGSTGPAGRWRSSQVAASSASTAPRPASGWRRVHPGQTVEDIRANTGFDFDVADAVQATPEPDTATLARLRGDIGRGLAETYPAFAARVLGVAA